jgi:hypothetical protein
VSIVVAIHIFLLIACSSPKDAYKSVTTPGYVKKAYKQLVVYAKVEEDVYRHKIEDAMVDVLNKNGYSAIPAYKNLSVSYKYDSIKFMNEINALNIDGIISLSYLGKQTIVEDRYHYTGGPYSLSAGGSVPFDLETRSTKIGYVRVDFFNRDTRSTQWNTGIPVKLSDGIDIVVQELSRECLSRLKGDKII